MDVALLDTDILNEVLKRRNATVVQHAAAYLAQHGQFAISSITWYKIFRGLLERGATTQLVQFQTFCAATLVLPVTDDVLARAAELWASGRKLGLAPNDADLMIVATAQLHGRTLVTGNTPHFAWIPGVDLANWRDP